METYAYISTNDTYLYSDSEGTNGLFLLPETYYVLVLELGKNTCQVSYGADTDDFPAVVGYVKTEQLVFVDYIPVRPYALCTVSLTYVLEGAPLDGSLSTYRTKATYYGDYYVGSNAYCYVYAGKFGYVARPELTIERNHDYVEEKIEEPPVTEQAIPTTTIFILFALFTIVTLVFALKSGKRQKERNDWYEVT